MAGFDVALDTAVTSTPHTCEATDMMPSIPQHAMIALSLFVVTTGNAAAWTSYGEPPGYGPPPSTGPVGIESQAYTPGYRPVYPMSAGPDSPGWPGTHVGAPGGPPNGSDMTRRVAAMPAPQMAIGGLRLVPEVTDEAYLLVIDLAGRDPAQVQVDAQRGGLLIRTRQNAQSQASEQFDDGRGVRRSYSWSSGYSSRRLPVPGDGDLAAMRREQVEGTIRIIIPRRQATAATPAAP